jgi:hypothetical protein
VVERLMHAGLVALRSRAHLPRPSGLEPEGAWAPVAATGNGSPDRAEVPEPLTPSGT